MARLSQIASVLITLRTATVGKASFGIPLIVSPATAFAERVRQYSNYDAAVSDKLDEATLRAINATLAQSPRPEFVLVGRRDVDNTTLSSTIATVQAGNNFTVSVNRNEFKYTAKEGDTVTEVMAGLAALISADTSVTDLITVASANNSLVLTPKNPGNQMIVYPVQNLKNLPKGSATNIAADLTKINTANKTWYGFALVERNDNLIMQASIWAEAQTKLFFACSGSTDIWDQESDDDIASMLNKGQYFRTALIAHKNAANEYPDTAWMGRCFTIKPGGETWALKVLSTIQPSDFSETEQAAIWAKQANTYEQYSDNIYLTNPGVVSAGEWIDIIRGRDYAVDLIQKDLASAMIRADKIPYTNAGIQICVNSVRGSLRTLQRAGVLAPDEVNSEGQTVPGFQITYPNAADVAASTKQTRKLYLTFRGILAGAIQVADITGALAYDYEGA